MANQWDEFADRFEKAQNDASDERERQKDHEDFLSTHGYNSWNELARTVQEACEHINSRRKGSEPYTFRRESEHQFLVIANVMRGQIRLQATFSPKTKSIEWRLDGAAAVHGKLTPTRAGEKFMYQDEGGTPRAVSAAAQFLLEKTF